MGCTMHSQRPYTPRPQPALLLFAIAVLVCRLVSRPGILQAAQATPAVEQAETSRPIDLHAQRYRQLFRELTKKYNFKQKQLEQLFAGVTISDRALELMENQAQTPPLARYLKLLLAPALVIAARQQMVDHKALLDRIEHRFGVDRQYVIAIWAIESKFGKRPGQFNVFRTLNTFFAAYPRRSAFYRAQLIQFLLLCRENSLDPKTIKGSYAGAFGQTQFMPASYRQYAVSFDGDDRRDVFNSIPDILASIANYLKRFHWVLHAPVYVDIGRSLKSQLLRQAHLQGLHELVPWRRVADDQGIELPRPPDDKPLAILDMAISPLLGGGSRYIAAYPNFRAITSWNNSIDYAMTVAMLAQTLSE